MPAMLSALRSSWLSCLLAAPLMASGAVLQPFAGSGSAPAAPWRVVGLPGQTKPFTRFSVVDLDGLHALRVEADSSYGNLVHPLHLAQPPHHLAWTWRVDEPNPAADLHAREGEDIAMKVCTLWDLPLDRVPFFERQMLRVARSRSGEPIPAATVCYVWDAHLPPGTELVSPFTGRLRFLVLRSEGDALHHWEHERRDIAADFMKLFGKEAAELPALVGVAVGADADNTHRHSVGHAAELQLEP
jgi:hypothetical protein